MTGIATPDSEVGLELSSGTGSSFERLNGTGNETETDGKNETGGETETGIRIRTDDPVPRAPSPSATETAHV